MTRPKLNDSIDTIFNDNRADESLTPSMAGGELKKIADYVDQEISNLPSSGKIYERTSQIYASASANPARVKNFFNGMELPDGVTETFTRVSSGIYRATYSGADTIEDLDLSSANKLFQFYFSDMPTNVGSDLKIQSIGSTNSGGTRTIFVEFHNLPSGVLTDNFGGYLNYTVKFFQ